MDDPRTTNLPEFTVSDISSAIKRTLEGEFGRIRVRGELTELKRYPSGHMYFSLKDEAAKLSGIVWKNSVSRLGLVPESGVEVVATGRISAYGERSSYQLIVERMEYAGAGALLARIEALRVRLAEEGLFDAKLKQSLPMLPRSIGVITSEKGAVIQDIRTTIARRFARDILLWPVAVQGDGAADQIAEAIRGFDSLPEYLRPDVLIVARGGGSLEDLMAFNDEAVIRAAAACRIPLISAVGHETDTTLIDFVSDCRAPTPTAAAEIAIPPRSDLLANVAQKAARLAGALASMTRDLRLRLVEAERQLPDLPSLLGGTRQRLDDRTDRLDLALPNLLVHRQASLRSAKGHLPDLGVQISMAGNKLTDMARQLDQVLPVRFATYRNVIGLTDQRLVSGLRQNIGLVHHQAAHILGRLSYSLARGTIREAAARMQGTGKSLEAVSPNAVLARGYVLVSDVKGTPVTHASDVKAGALLRLRFADGEVRATADGARSADRQASLPF
jgi:exodeoxyribonuclease VII large subunit